MKIKILKSKIHRATVTEACLDYEGSIAIDSQLLKKSGISTYEKVHILNVTNGNRLETYAILSSKAGHICINGAAAHLVSPGDIVIIVSYGEIKTGDVKKFNPKIVLVDNKNKIISK